MRGFIVMAMFVASLASAAYNDFEETRELNLDAKGIEELSIEAGAGSMDVVGVAGLDTIEVIATIVVPDADAEEAARIIQKKMRLDLDKNGAVAKLDAWFDHGIFGFGSDAYIVLDVKVPTGMAVIIDDGSGSIDVIGTEGDLTIDDGSGSIEIESVANVNIDDGSGSVDIRDAAGNVSIVDGSGSITVRGVTGSVTIDDGSGGIRVTDVENDLIITDDGSGGLSFENVRGKVEQQET